MSTEPLKVFIVRRRVPRLESALFVLFMLLADLAMAWGVSAWLLPYIREQVPQLPALTTGRVFAIMLTLGVTLPSSRNSYLWWTSVESKGGLR